MSDHAGNKQQYLRIPRKTRKPRKSPRTFADVYEEEQERLRVAAEEEEMKQEEKRKEAQERGKELSRWKKSQRSGPPKFLKKTKANASKRGRGPAAKKARKKKKKEPLPAQDGAGR